MTMLSSTPQVFKSNSLGASNFFSSNFSEKSDPRPLPLHSRILSAGATRRDVGVTYAVPFPHRFYVTFWAGIVQMASASAYLVP
jgi:hypothetical protein